MATRSTIAVRYNKVFLRGGTKTAKVSLCCVSVRCLWCVCEETSLGVVYLDLDVWDSGGRLGPIVGPDPRTRACGRFAVSWGW